MRWTVHGERAMYSSPWMSVHLVDVELPDGARFEHHALRMPNTAAGTVLYDPSPDRGVLLLYRHRFIGDFWGWEIPAGRVETGEDPADAARREAREEVGWEPTKINRLTSYRFASGSSDGEFHLFFGTAMHEIGPPTDLNEAERIAWFSPNAVRELIAAGEIHDGLTLTGLLWAFSFGLFGNG